MDPAAAFQRPTRLPGTSRTPRTGRFSREPRFPRDPLDLRDPRTPGSPRSTTRSILALVISLTLLLGMFGGLKARWGIRTGGERASGDGGKHRGIDGYAGAGTGKYSGDDSKV